MVTMKFLYNECLQVCFSECLLILFSTWKIFWFGLDNVMWNKSLNEINLRCLLQGAFTSCSDGKRAASVGHKVCWNLIRCASHMSYFHCPQSRVCTGDVWAGSGWMDILWGGGFSPLHQPPLQACDIASFLRDARGGGDAAVIGGWWKRLTWGVSDLFAFLH